MESLQQEMSCHNIFDCAGDVVEVVLPMRVTTEKIQDTRAQFANLQVGPLHGMFHPKAAV